MTETIQAAESLSGALKAAVIDLLYRLADDELIIGHRNSEWTGLAPILEADIAFSSMAQDEMGHALAYYNLLHELGEDAADKLAFTRNAGQFRCASLVALERQDWAFSIVRQFLYDCAENVRLTALCQSTYAPLAALARKLLAEEKYHLMHGRSWIVRLGSADDESHERMQAALTAAMPHALGMFEPTPHSQLLFDAGVCPAEDELQRQWLDTIGSDIAEAGLKHEPLPEPHYGGRSGKCGGELVKLLDDMQKVFRLDPTASW